MHILRVVHSMNPEKGGISRWVLSSSLALLGKGHKVTILSIDDPQSQFLANLPLDCIALGPSSGYAYSNKLIPFLLNNKDYDVIIIEGIWQYIGWAVYKACLKTKIPYFVFVHGMLDPWFNKAYPFKFLKKYLYWLFFEYKVLKNANRVIFTSEQEKDLAQTSFYPFCIKPAVVPLGIENLLSPSEDEKKLFFDHYPALKDKRILLYLGRIHPKKGLDILLQAWSVLKNQDTENQAMLILAGPFSSCRYKRKLSKIIKVLNIEHSILQLAMQGSHEKTILYSVAEAFILPSHQENVGLVLLESMALGTPVLTTTKVNISNLIAESEGGFIKEDTLEGVSKLLRSWWHLKSKDLEKLKSNARNCFLKYFSLEKSIDSLVNILKK